MASAIKAEERAVTDTCLFVFLVSLAHGRVFLKPVCTTTLHAVALVRFYLAGLRACLVSKEVAAAADDQGGLVYKLYCSYLPPKHGYWSCQYILCDGAVGVRESEGDCTVAPLDAVQAHEPLWALGKRFSGEHWDCALHFCLQCHWACRLSKGVKDQDLF